MKLERRGLIRLPARRQTPCNRMRSRAVEVLAWNDRPVECSLSSLRCWEAREISSQAPERKVFAAALGGCILFPTPRRR